MSKSKTDIQIDRKLLFLKRRVIAKSLAIGTPADGFYALRVRKKTGSAAGGVTVGAAMELIASGKIPAKGPEVVCTVGNGLKTLDAVVGHVGKTRETKPSLREFDFDAWVSNRLTIPCVRPHYAPCPQNLQSTSAFTERNVRRHFHPMAV